MLTTAKIAGWAFGELLLSGEIEHIDTEVQKALDGVGGGTYAPVDQVIIGGAGLRITTVLDITGTINITGNTTIGNSDADTLSVIATPEFEAPATFNDGIIITAGGAEVHGSSSFGANLTVSGDLSVAGELDVTSAVTFHDDLTLATGGNFNCNGTASFDGDVDFTAGATFHAGLTIPTGDTLDCNGTLDVDGPADFSGPVTLRSLLNTSGSGRVRMRHSTTLGNTDETVDVTDGNIFRLPDDNSAFRTYTISDDEAGPGDFMIFYQNDGTNLDNQVNINSNGGISSIFTTGAAGCYAFYVFNGSSWHKIFSFNS
jgi:hypothetical protein